MGSDRVFELARSLSREEFVKRFPCWFLVITDAGEEEPPSSFETVADGSASPHAFLAAKPTIEAHDIAKAPGNPYPDRISVGRARNCDVVLRHGSVSKLHARFSPRPDGQLDLIDVGSQVGTRVNGRVLEPNTPVRVGLSFVVLLGRVVTRVSDARTVWDLLKAHQRLDESPLPPGSSPRGSSPAPAPRSSSPGPVALAPPTPQAAPYPGPPAAGPAPRGSSPGPAPPISSPGSVPPSGKPPGSGPPPRSR